MDNLSSSSSGSNNNIDRRLLLGAAGIAGAAALSKLAHAGPLAPPPGPVTPTGLTLDELAARTARPGGLAEPRIPVTAQTCPPSFSAAFNITQPGSYYLTGDINFYKDIAIAIAADDVTLDLCGYAIRPETAGSGDAILIDANRVAVRNGVISGTARGVLTAAAERHNHVLEDLRITCASSAISIPNSSAARRCTVRGGAGIGAAGQNSLFSECHVSQSGTTGIALFYLCTAERCQVIECGTGVTTGPHCRIADCSILACAQGVNAASGVLIHDSIVSLNVGTGITTGQDATVTGCRVDQNAGGGIVATQRASVDRCDLSANTGRAITVNTGSRVTRCTIANHTAGSGPAGVKLLGSNCIVEQNYFTNNFVAVDAVNVTNNLVARNTCLGNANFISVNIGGNWYPNTPLGGVNTDTNPHNNIIG